MKKGLENVFMITAIVAILFFASSAMAEDTGYHTIYALETQWDGDVVVRLNNGLETWYKAYPSSNYKDQMLAVLLTALSTGREVKLYLNENNPYQIIVVRMR